MEYGVGTKVGYSSGREQVSGSTGGKMKARVQKGRFVKVLDLDI